MAMGLVEQGFDTYISQASFGNVDVHRWVSTLDVRLSCIKCHTRMVVADEVIYKPGIPEGIVKFCIDHRHEETNVNGPYTFDTGLGEIKVGFNVPETSSDSNTDLVLAVAKASNFNVNVQGKTVRFSTQYRILCNVCSTSLDLGTRVITKAEIENPTTDASKFCVEHQHRPNVKMIDATNFRKFRDE